MGTGKRLPALAFAGIEKTDGLLEKAIDIS
jgi:hypothetical protein